MKEIKVVSFWGTETNPYANPETAGDGGGYFQPSGGCVLSTPGCREVLVEYEDANCGDFGTREFWTVSAPSRRLEWRWAQGSMDDDSIEPVLVRGAGAGKPGGCPGRGPPCFLQHGEGGHQFGSL